MANHQGIFIVLEGVDGSGKTTQFKLLQTRLQLAGYEVEVFDFPRYDKPSSYFVRQYLNGQYGPASSINPYSASLFYALDRYEAAPEIRKALAAGKIVLSDRYVGSNMAHQGSKFGGPIEKRSFFVWADSLEFQVLGIPRPDINLFLRVPAEVSYELIARRGEREYTSKVRDEHEADFSHLKQSVATYDLLCQLFPRDFKAINCVSDDELLSIKEINHLIWKQLEPILPPLHKTNPPKADKSTSSPDQKAEPSEINWQIDAISLLAIDELRLKQIQIDANPVWRERGKYPYFRPTGLNTEAKTSFDQAMEKLIDNYKLALSKLTKYLDSSGQARINLKPVLPLCATTSASIVIAKSQAIEILAKLKTSNTKEVIALGNLLTAEVEQTWPGLFSEYSSAWARPPESIGQIIEKLTQDLLPQQLSNQDEAVKLLEVTPRNEFDILADSLYSFSTLSRPDIQAEIDQWDYSKKSDALSKALTRPEVLNLAKYNFDFLTSKQLLSLLLAHHLVQDVQTQPISPRYGYGVPVLIDSAGVDGEYLDMFDQSLELYSQLQASAFAEPEYACLRGHRLRWQSNLSAKDIARIKKLAANEADLAEIAALMVDKLTEFHPHIARRLEENLEKPADKTARVEPKNPSSQRRRRSRGGRTKKP
jgi:dTMP kinase